MSQIFTKIRIFILIFVQNMHHKVAAKLGLKTYLFNCIALFYHQGS